MNDGAKQGLIKSSSVYNFGVTPGSNQLNEEGKKKKKKVSK